MDSFPTLLKRIREESGLTQGQLASVLGISTILVSMVETGQKEVSKNFVIRLAEKLEVQPSSIMPFIVSDVGPYPKNLSAPERALIKLGQKFQEYLIRVKARKLKEYV